MYFNNPNLLSQIDTHTHTLSGTKREKHVIVFYSSKE